METNVRIGFVLLILIIIGLGGYTVVSMSKKPTCPKCPTCPVCPTCPTYPTKYTYTGIPGKDLSGSDIAQFPQYASDKAKLEDLCNRIPECVGYNVLTTPPGTGGYLKLKKYTTDAELINAPDKTIYFRP